METPILLDAAGVPLRPGQRVLYASAGIHATGALQAGEVVKAYISPFGGGERIVIRRDDRKTICVNWSRRVVVIAQLQETEADVWLRQQLSKLEAE
jgi:hypothetical protein